MSQLEVKDVMPTIPTDYSKVTITDIRRGKGARNVFVYAKLRNEKGEVVINGTLDYIMNELEDRLPGKPEDDYDHEL
jgi:hypothetical protein